MYSCYSHKTVALLVIEILGFIYSCPKYYRLDVKVRFSAIKLGESCCNFIAGFGKIFKTQVSPQHHELLQRCDSSEKHRQPNLIKSHDRLDICRSSDLYFASNFLG
jgi:hypothetical protein